ncbi:MAG TPA: hypothetical protein VN622_08555 [Clostridia bacterium]|nr:hypothetical protein [Clostridia bacterium]
MYRTGYEAMAKVLTYPDQEYTAAVRAFREEMPVECSVQAVEFASCIEALSLQVQQELFTQTFDLNPMCSLELGWHLFGENYERGLLLVRMREELRAAGVPERGELPDHLTYALRLLPRIERERGADFVCAIVLPALMKMWEAMRGKNNPYEKLLQSLAALLNLDFPDIPPPETKVELPILPQEVTL